MSVENDNIIDVGFEEVKSDKDEKIYKTLSEVARLLNEPDATVRVWCNHFNEALQIERSGRNRMFKQKNIDDLLLVKSLIRDKGFKHTQVLEYLLKRKYGNENELVVTEENPLALKAISVALSEEIKPLLEAYRETILEEISITLTENDRNRKLELEEFKNSISEIVEKQLDFIDTKEQEAKDRDNEILDFLKNSMENRQQNEKQDKKGGIFSRFFKK